MMVRNSKLERVLERNDALASTNPIPIGIATRHFDALLQHVHKTGKTVYISVSGRVRGCMQPVAEEVKPSWD